MGRRKKEDNSLKMHTGKTMSEVMAVLDAGPNPEIASRWLVEGNTITRCRLNQRMPCGQTFVFDDVFAQKSSRYIYQKRLRNLVKHFCHLKQSAAIILYGGSTTDKSSFIRTPLAPKNGFLHCAVHDIFSYMQETSRVLCQLRVSYVELYNERIEDLLATDLHNDLNEAPQSAICLARDAHGCITWPHAESPVISTPFQVEEMYVLGHNEHVMRGRRTQGRMEAAHTIFRFILESIPRDCEHTSWDTVRSAVAYLDLVRLGCSSQVSPFTKPQDQFNVIPPVNRSLNALQSFVLHYHNHHNALYDGHQSLLTQILRAALVGSSRSAFVLVCDPADITEMQATLKFGEAASKLVQCPRTLIYPGSDIHKTVEKVLTHISALYLGLSSKAKSDMKQAVKEEWFRFHKGIEDSMKHFQINSKEVQKHMTELKALRQTIFPNILQTDSQKAMVE